MLNDQSGLVLGDGTVFSWASCHKRGPNPDPRQPRINSFAIRRRGAEKRGTPIRRGEDRAS
jgi:hypothetical protein